MSELSPPSAACGGGPVNEVNWGGGSRTARYEQAATLERLLPLVMGSLFGRREDDPLAQTPLGQVRLLRKLSEGPHLMSELAQALDTSMSGLTQMAHRLEESGWVVKLPDERDRRARWLALTPEGEQMIRARIQCRVGFAEKAMESVAPEKIEQLIDSLEELARQFVVVPKSVLEPRDEREISNA